MGIPSFVSLTRTLSQTRASEAGIRVPIFHIPQHFKKCRKESKRLSNFLKTHSARKRLSSRHVFFLALGRVGFVINCRVKNSGTGG